MYVAIFAAHILDNMSAGISPKAGGLQTSAASQPQAHCPQVQESRALFHVLAPLHDSVVQTWLCTKKVLQQQ